MEITDTKLECQRGLFNLPDDICWLNSAYMSPLLHSVREAGLEGVELRGRPWNISADDFFEPAEQVRSLVAGLIYADADGVALVPSVSYGIGIATANLPVTAGQNIVVVEEQFPSNIYPWRELANERNAIVRTVSIPEGGWTESIINHIDKDTSVVSIPHVHWTTGAEFDLVRIGAQARSVGAALVVDATQSLGILTFDVEKIQPDFLVAAAYKCMLGPYGLSYLYVAPRWRKGKPLEEGWLNRTNAADFSQLTEYCDDYLPGARRYDFGERSNTILLAMAIASLEQITAWKTERIEQYTRPLVQRIVAKADEMELWHPPVESCSPCMVGISLPGGSPNTLGKQLAANGIYVSVRKGNARIATHVYNTEDEIDRFFDVLRDLT
ncbi:aminotransferase class V-fold PLP-dependent enzyme [Gimesia aquarii]|nr:aminotransferase class V-fold PLP-dependent enzyme [Gimesia aquarii]